MSLSFRRNGNYVDFINTDDTSLHVETTIMSLHNTSALIQSHIVGAYTGSVSAAGLAFVEPVEAHLYSCVTDSQSFLGFTGDRVHQVAAPQTRPGQGDFAGENVTMNTNTLDKYDNQALNLGDWNNGTDYSGGNAANTLTATVYYVVVDL